MASSILDAADWLVDPRPQEGQKAGENDGRALARINASTVNGEKGSKKKKSQSCSGQ